MKPLQTERERIDRETVKRAFEEGSRGEEKMLCALLETLAHTPPTAQDWRVFALEVTEAWKRNELPVGAFEVCLQRLPSRTVLRLARSFERVSDDEILLRGEGGLGGVGIKVLGAKLNLLGAGTLSRMLFRAEDEEVALVALERILSALDDETVPTDIQAYMRKNARRLFERWMRRERVIGLLARLTGRLYRDEEE